MHTLLDYSLMFLASFVMVTLFGLQSKNVQHSRYFPAFFISIGISVSNFIFVRYAAVGTYDVMMVTATGGAFGIITAIYLHDKAVQRKNKRKNKQPKPQIQKYYQPLSTK